MKLYTKQGDSGFSSLSSGKKIKKSDNVFHILGGIDEVSCFLGLAKCKCKEKELFQFIETIQKDLMKIMAYIASEGEEKYIIGEETLKELEEKTDFFYTSRLLNSKEEKSSFEFVLPGKSELSSYFNLARCEVRKAERYMAKDCENSNFCESNFKYINRLSDFLFSAAVYSENL